MCKHVNLEPLRVEDTGAIGMWFLIVRCKDCGRTGYQPIDKPVGSGEDQSIDWDPRTKKKKDDPGTLEEKAHARIEIWKNLTDVVKQIQTLGSQSDGVGRVFETIEQIHAALKMYFEADEKIDVRTAPNLKRFIAEVLASQPN